jgi:hypothetical protein
MVKQKSSAYADRYMTEYRMRTPYATPTKMHRSSPDQHTARSTQRHTAHDKSHLRHGLPSPHYHSEGRIDKNTRDKKPPPQQNHLQTNNYHHATVHTAPKKSSCCIIL